jgi:hypothetical protein
MGRGSGIDLDVERIHPEDLLEAIKPLPISKENISFLRALWSNTGKLRVSLLVGSEGRMIISGNFDIVGGKYSGNKCFLTARVQVEEEQLYRQICNELMGGFKEEYLTQEGAEQVIKRLGGGMINARVQTRLDAEGEPMYEIVGVYGEVA